MTTNTHKLKYGTVVENADGTKVYTKQVSSHNIMRKFQAWGFQKDEVARMKAMGVTTVRLYVKYDGTYETDATNLFNALEGNYGFGNQRFVPVDKFTKVTQ